MKEGYTNNPLEIERIWNGILKALERYKIPFHDGRNWIPDVFLSVSVMAAVEYNTERHAFIACPQR
jgi:hypothetical protein